MTASGAPKISLAPKPPLMSEARRAGANEIRGYVVDPGDLDRRFVVEAFLDDCAFALARADRHRVDLAAAGLGDGCYGFAIALPEVFAEDAIVTLALANAGEPVGEPVALGAPPAEPSPDFEGGEARWLGGLGIGGWVEAAPEGAERRIRAMVEGACVAETRASVWTRRGDSAAAALRFELRLPPRFADARVRRVHIVDDEGRELAGSPCAVAAFDDPLVAGLGADAPQSQRLRGELASRLAPLSVPFEDFAAWRERFPVPRAEPAPRGRIAVALIGEAGLAASLASLEAQEDCDWIAAPLADAGAAVAFDPAELVRLLEGEAADCAYVAFAPAGAAFAPRALSHLAAALDAAPQRDLVYCDIAVAEAGGGAQPLAFPAFDEERALEQGYPCLVFLARKATALAAARDGAGDLYRLFFFGLEAGGGANTAPAHVPGFLATLPAFDPAARARRLGAATIEFCARRGREAKAVATRGALLPAVRLTRRGPIPALTLVVAARRGADWLSGPGQPILAAARGHDCEVLIVARGEAPNDLEAEGVQIRGVAVEADYSLPRYANVAATAANGEWLLFLSDDLTPPDSAWLGEMLGRTRADEVGAVAPLLLDPDARILAAGYALGPGFAARAACVGLAADDPGYADRLRVAHQVGAAPAAGLMTRRDLFRDLGGFDVARFARGYADIDYGLRLRARGKRILCAPAARLVARRAVAPDDACERELGALRLRWGEALLDDPCYSPMLALDGPPFGALAWPPRGFSPRAPDPPRPAEP